MNVEMIGPIQPWGDQNSHIPQKLFQKREKLHTQIKNKLDQLCKTEQSIERKLKTEQNGLTFRKTRKNFQERIFTLDFKRNKQANSNLRKVLCGSGRQETVLVGRRKSKKFIQINSLKKKIVDFDIHESQPTQSLHFSKVLQKKLFSQHKLNDLKYRLQQKIKTNDESLVVKKANISYKPKKKSENSLFFSTIANIKQQKSKFADSQFYTLGDQIQVERKMFLKKNRKFRSWQNLTKHTFSMSSTSFVSQRNFMFN